VILTVLKTDPSYNLVAFSIQKNQTSNAVANSQSDRGTELTHLRKQITKGPIQSLAQLNFYLEGHTIIVKYQNISTKLWMHNTTTTLTQQPVVL
jgi:hypothetical protein